ncbi:MAG: lipoyl(octanoyl) transferase LipB [Pseudomonadota bacterium]
MTSCSATEKRDNFIAWRDTPDPVPYLEAVHAMETLVAQIKDGLAPQTVWCLQHPPLYTAGTSAKADDLRQPRFPVFDTGRGGQYTYHGPGQLVAYVMLDLRQYYLQPDIRDYVCRLESWIIKALAQFGIAGERRVGRIGIWVTQPDGREDKIAAIGVRVRHGVTYHGISINVHPDLSHFSGIVPCGITEHGVTSFHALGLTDVTVADVRNALQAQWAEVF